MGGEEEEGRQARQMTSQQVPEGPVPFLCSARMPASCEERGAGSAQEDRAPGRTARPACTPPLLSVHLCLRETVLLPGPRPGPAASSGKPPGMRRLVADS